MNTQIDVPVITGLVFLLSLCGREYICVRCGGGNAVVINCVVMQFGNVCSRLSNFGCSGEVIVRFYRVINAEPFNPITRKVWTNIVQACHGLSRSLVRGREEVEIVIRERSRMQESYFFRDGIFKFVPRSGQMHHQCARRLC